MPGSQLRLANSDASRLAALLQLASPALPVGGYSYSQGLERAIADGLVTDRDSAGEWIHALLAGPVATFEAPVWLRLHAAWRAGEVASFGRWNKRYLASRESGELRAETLQMGGSTARLAKDLGLRAPEAGGLVGGLTYPAAHAALAAELGVSARDCATAYVFSGVENLVAAAIKAVPLGQVAGQRILLDAHELVGAAIDTALTLGDDELASSAPGLALLSALHETQYSRLFRS
jgi:urease accessory protein